MNPTEPTDAEIIDLTGDLSDTVDSPDENRSDRRNTESRCESPWRSLHLTGRPWYREDTERRERELERIERKHRREAAALLDFYQTKEFRDKIGRLALRPRSPAESVGCEKPTAFATSATRGAEHEPHAKVPPAQSASNSSPQPATPADEPSPAKPSPKVAPDPSRGHLVPEPAKSVTEPPPTRTTLNVVPAVVPAPEVASEPAREPLLAASATKPSPTKPSEVPQKSEHSDSSAQPAWPDTKRVCGGFASAVNACRPGELRKQRLFATDDDGTSASTGVDEKPARSPPTQSAFGFSTLGQRAVAEMLASEALRTGTVRDGMQFLGERREARAKRGSKKPARAFAQSTNSQAPPKKSPRSRKAVDKRTTTAQHLDLRSVAKKRESTSPRRPTPSPHPPSRRFHHATWPAKVASIRQQYNPLEICLEYETPFAGFCGCDSPCRHDTCRNGALGIFCAPNCCLYDGKCGNGLAEIDNVKLVRRDQSSELAVVATAPIEKGIVIGQYLGKFITLEADGNHSSDDFDNFAVPTLNTGYRYEFKRDSMSHPGVKIFIDAEKYGCIARFLNHSCKAAAQFREVRNGSRHTVVVVAVRDIKSGEEITVDYGTDIWFVCQCKELNCRHRYVRLVPQQ